MACIVQYLLSCAVSLLMVLAQTRCMAGTSRYIVSCSGRSVLCFENAPLEERGGT
jgi:hypothetical protein